MNIKLARRAERALTVPRYVRLPHFCQRFIRQVIEAEYGKKFAPYMKRSATETALAFLDSPYNVPLEHGSTVGDLLYKTHGSGGDGHVGIRIAGNRVAENSSVHWGEDKDARGVRTLREFGNFDVIVRLK